MAIRIAKLIFCISFSALFMVSCAEPNLEPMCEEHGQSRSCTKKELAMIEDMHTIIRSIHKYQDVSAKTTWLERKNSSTPRVIFYGESHPEIIGRIQTLGAINEDIRKGTVLLLEGADWQNEHFSDCGIELIFSLFLQWQFEKLGKTYQEFFRWQKSQEFNALLETTIKSYDLTGLNIGKLTCGYWDDGLGLRQSFANLHKVPLYLKQRNRAMVQAIKVNLERYDQVLINTGLAHLPSGERYTTYRRNKGTFSVPEDLDAYYAMIKAEKKSPPHLQRLKFGGGEGSTKVIYKYLKEENIPFCEKIHGKMVSKPWLL